MRRMTSELEPNSSQRALFLKTSPCRTSSDYIYLYH